MSSAPGASQGLWTRNFVLNLLTGHFTFVSYTALFTIIPPYVLDLGGKEWHIGVVIGSFGVVGLVIRPFAGRWVSVFGATRIAVLGAAILGVASLLHILAPSVWWLVPVRMLQGVGLAMGPVATTTMVANLAPASRRAEGMALMGNSIAVASLYSPVLSFWLMGRFGFPASFLFSGSSGLLAAVIATGISSAKTPVSDLATAGRRVPLISRGALFPTAVFLSYTLTTAPVNTFLPLLAEDRGLGNPGLFFSIFSFTTMAVMLWSGTVADRLGRSAVIIPGLLVNALSMVLLSVASNQAVFLTAALLAGSGFGLLQPGMQSLVVDRVPPRERASGVATLQAAWDIGGSGGAFILGPVAAAVSVASTFGIVAAGAVVGAAGFALGGRRALAPTPGQD